MIRTSQRKHDTTTPCTRSCTLRQQYIHIFDMISHVVSYWTRPQQAVPVPGASFATRPGAPPVGQYVIMKFRPMPRGLLRVEGRSAREDQGPAPRPRRPTRTTTTCLRDDMATLWIINKAGGLIYTGGRPQPHLSSNDALVLAGTLHGVHAITSRLAPDEAAAATANATHAAAAATGGDGGMTQLQASDFDLTIRATPTGIKLVILTPRPGVDAVPTPVLHHPPPALLQGCYEAYADTVMRNPFYTPEMPIRIEAFDQRIAAILGAQ